ncbi:MFS transporter [Schlegelella sp. S2-27]|uniref:MFS transporter n=2 Tax=Caldimonas mangrovi TaxID=2944811 RepID=A0ABT0YLH3_9BURK|nr:MFS transporter [Caldimonas mangrovi]MCM5679584.1 MFS transporter [Caldimonas mangrovi]
MNTGARAWLGLAVIAVPCLAYAMDLTLLHLALPTLSAQLDADAMQALWIADIYGFMVAGLLWTMGALGDRWGRRRVLLLGAALFALASLLAALARSPAELVLARALQGVAGATIAPSTLALIRSLFADRRQRATALGLWIASFSAGTAAGPAVGGWLLEHGGWQMAFLVNLPAMGLVLVLGPWLLPEARDPSAQRVDLVVCALSLPAVLGSVQAFKSLVSEGPGFQAASMAALALAAAAGAMRRSRNSPGLPAAARLWRQPGVRPALAVNLLATFLAAGTSLLGAHYLQTAAFLSPVQAGLWMLPAGVATAVGALLAPLAMRRWSLRPSLVVAFSAAMAAMLLLAWAASSGMTPAFATGMVLLAVATVPIGVASTEWVIGHASSAEAGRASALSETSFELGGAFGIAALGSVAAAHYRDAMEGAGGLAADTFAAAAAAAAHLEPMAAQAVLSAARQSAAAAVAASATVGAGVAAAGLVLVLAALRRGQPRGASAARGALSGSPRLSRRWRHGTIARMSPHPPADPHLRDLARLRRVRDRIDRDYAQPLNVEALARGVHMSAGHLSRQFRLAYGESPYAYLMTRRIERAMTLLRRGDLSVTEVCFAVGCGSLGTFSTRFTELVGLPPSAYRQQGTHAIAGIPPCVAKQVSRPIRNREAPVTQSPLDSRP